MGVTRKKSKLHMQSFYAGVLSALAIVAAHDERTLFDEIVDATGEIELVKRARRDGAMRWSGLSKYRYGRGEFNGREGLSNVGDTFF